MWLSPFLASRRLRRRVVRACLARHEVNYGRSFFDEGQCVAAASAVEVTGLGFVDQLAQQAASANAEGAHDRCHAPLVAALLTPELLYAAKHLSIHATLLTNSRSRRSLPRRAAPAPGRWAAVFRKRRAGLCRLIASVGNPAVTVVFPEPAPGERLLAYNQLPIRVTDGRKLR